MPEEVGDTPLLLPVLLVCSLAVSIPFTTFGGFSIAGELGAPDEFTTTELSAGLEDLVCLFSVRLIFRPAFSNASSH